MQHISNLSIAVMYVMYFLAALFGYLTFYGMAGSALSGIRGPGWEAKGCSMATVDYRRSLDVQCVTVSCSCGGESEYHSTQCQGPPTPP